MNNKKKQNNFRSDSFFEAFRELGGGTRQAAKDAAMGIGGDMIRQVTQKNWTPQPLSGEISMGEHLDIDIEIQRREKDIIKKERSHLEYVRREEQLVFNRKEEQLKEQIKSIQEELKKELEKLAEEAGGLVGELEIAVEQTIVSPGTYHLNFFDKIRQLFILLRKRVHESKTWMHTVNSRSSHRSFYWGSVGKSGTKFMLSQERYMSTQAG